MANNRIYLRCKSCGEEFFLGKRLTDGYWLCNYHEERGSIMDQLNEFYDKHTYCKGNGQDCFEIAYEMPEEWDVEDSQQDHDKKLEAQDEP